MEKLKKQLNEEVKELDREFRGERVYEFWGERKVKDINGNEVILPQRTARVTKSKLEEKIAELEKQKEAIEEDLYKAKERLKLLR